jgi:DNA polymerase III alpha subunit
MDNIPAYVRRKHGQEAVSYLHRLLEPFLERTYGIFVYQEDIMAAAMAWGALSRSSAMGSKAHATCHGLIAYQSAYLNAKWGGGTLTRNG